MLGHGTKVEGNGNDGVDRTEVTMYLTWTTTAVPLPRRRFHRDHHVIVSFDHATTSPGTRTLCTASHIACTVRGEDDQRNKFRLIFEILTGKYYPDDHRVRGDTVSSAGSKIYKPV